ncbi:HECT-like ubiquitin-conjugating enzyme-binding-domain-containing protein [Paraphoma chrysanthemicola]|uniref:HECT-like ubiquitin-conjugating enzyme-binding-domain-containing protein n=1 Tax=Paraphoma chrysanthemicola TaxID=798071 RepID=A0A8K0VXY6_9PLEO|nr:HECT-like ubiquitin-conjugating enzyme-binding-domain-containing protein [Paraphoma chrysanthemicola]
MSRPILPESAYEALGLDPATIKILMNPKPPVVPPDIAAPNLLQSDEDSARPLEPNETAITLYAELLLHIRTITLFASLRSYHDRGTKAKLSSDGDTITVSHEGQSSSIRMPFNIKGAGEAELELPAQPSNKELTVRLQLEELEDSDVLGALQSEDRRVNIVPWDGAALDKQPHLEVRCKSCGGVIVPQGSITQWRDLPNENWAEMMDFWHCHKPDEHHLHDHTHADAIGEKGYAAGNKLQAVDGVGFVDLTSFLMRQVDCDGAQAQFHEATQQRIVLCKHCQATLGTADDISDGWRIWKWNIDISPTSRSSSDAGAFSTQTLFSPQKWITARLLYLIENTGVRKFHIHPTTSSTATVNGSTESEPTPVSSLLIWVFTPDLLFSSSIPSPNRYDPTRSMKVFYQRQTWQPLKPGEPESASMEDVEFPEGLFEELRHALVDSQKVLPPTARKFQGWEVGLLQRFDVGDLAAASNDQENEHEHGHEDSDGNIADASSGESEGESEERGRGRHRTNDRPSEGQTNPYKASVEDET